MTVLRIVANIAPASIEEARGFYRELFDLDMVRPGCCWQPLR